MIPLGRLILYALPALPLALPILPAAVLLPAHYAEQVGLGLAATAFALTLARLVDVVTDPLIGILCDRWGGRKLWIALGAGLAGVALVRVFDPPAGADGAYLLLWSLLLYLGWTLVQIPYQAWGVDLCTDYHGRARLAGAREAAGVAGLVLAGGLALGGLERVAWVAVALGAPLIALALIAVPTPAAPAPVPLDRQALRALLGNRPFRRLLLAWGCNGVATGVPSVLFPFFAGHVLARPDAVGWLLLAYFLAAILAVPVWLWLARRIDKHRSWCVAMIGACLAFVPVPWLGAGDVVAFAVICLITGAALGADLALPPAMQADIVDYGALRDRGTHRPAVYFALWTMATKAALALSVAVALPLVGAFGFDPRQDQQPADALLALAVIYAAVPTVAKACAVALLLGHPLTQRRHAIIRRRLDRRSTRITP